MQIRGDSIRLVRGVFDVRAAQVAKHAGRSRPWMIRVESTPELTPYVARQAIGGLFAAVLENLDREARGNPMDRREPHAQVRPGVRSVRVRRHARRRSRRRRSRRWCPVHAREAARESSGGTLSAATGDDRHPTREAKAVASHTNRGAVQRAEQMERERPAR